LSFQFETEHVHLPCKYGAQTGYDPFWRIETHDSNGGQRLKTELESNKKNNTLTSVDFYVYRTKNFAKTEFCDHAVVRRAYSVISCEV
jgi:hypothetical protein